MGRVIFLLHCLVVFHQPPRTTTAGDRVVGSRTTDLFSSSSFLDSGFSTDPGFTGTPTRYSSFAGRGGELPRVSSSQSLKSSGSAKRRNAAARRKTKEAPICSSVTKATNPHKVSLKSPLEEDGNAKRSKIKAGSGDEKDEDEPKAPSRTSALQKELEERRLAKG
ncbi:hypothetical protein HPP92_021462 [Vanilla planifolia]|uniref:Uncharacterized protein n=1 Tax=Vanilla planifolia TaxID=51239 RepID=A0A835PVL9_VANPL|nr:hypothetical protein HPP92_021462 [Vanilla planifolia]